MAGDFTPLTLEQCTLWKRLNKPFNDVAWNNLAKSIAPSLIPICQLACDRMKLMPTFHPEFTLHDETHLMRVTELMARVIPANVLESVLNPAEITLLMLSAHFHDVGMVPDADEVARIKESREFSLARDNWLVEFEAFRDATRILSEPDANLTDKKLCERVVAEHEAAILLRFLRENHAKYSAEFVRSRFGSDDRLRIGTGHLAESLALLCLSHNWPADQLTESNGFLLDKAIGTFPVNLQYLATILRLADILDFDRERTPDELFRSISFRNPISIEEWEKHRSVTGWKIDQDAVRFECACEHPQYDRTIHRFLGFIDEELAAAHEMCRRFPSRFSNYRFDLPVRTDRSRIKPKQGAYIQALDLEISISRDEIIRLLMTEKLYGHPSLAIRELLQNSWDALRHRSAIIKRDEQMEWTLGAVEFEHGVNSDNREYIRCTDNGVGMDEQILKNYLVRAGRSYYRSPEFERERLTFAQKGADFDPCARFGIGFMSIFMLGDQITIWTRRYNGLQGGLAKPLIVDINGIGGLIVLREGPASQPAGTTIEIVGRRKPDRFLSHHDKVKLIDTIYAFALAGEFPVHAICTIPEIADELSLPAGVARTWHPLVEFEAGSHVAFAQSFTEIDPLLTGQIITAVPLSEDGRLVTANNHGGWKMEEKPSGASYWTADSEKLRIWKWEGRTCLDGILVAGPQGRGRLGWCLVGTQYPNPIDFGEDLFVLDVRGNLKPELTPHRSPPDGHGPYNEKGPGWRRLRRLAAIAHGKLWEKVIERFSSPADIKTLWQLLALHQVQISTLRRGFIWEKLPIPSLTSSNELIFRPFSSLTKIPFIGKPQGFFNAESDGTYIAVDEEMSVWRSINNEEMVIRTVREVVCALATLTLDEGTPVLTHVPPINSEELGFSQLVFDHFDRRFATMPFGDGLEEILVAEAAERLLNRGHPIAKWLLKQQDGREDRNFSFLHSLAGALLDEGALTALATGDLKRNRHNWHFSQLGYRFRHADLASLNTTLHPPYYCWHPDFGKFEISADTLEKLAQLQALDWDRYSEPRYI